MNILEGLTIEGESPVNEMHMTLVDFPSMAGHEKSRLNLPGPSGKAKYYSVTDSELVP